MDDIEMSSNFLPQDEDALLVSRNRLPTLFEVLSRRTLSPIDLYSFYIYMRDQQRSVDYLDFWLDISYHLQICRLYVRNLHSSVLVGESDFSSGPVTQVPATPTKDASASRNVTRADLRASAQKILYTYLIPGSTREITIPQSILGEVVTSVEEQGRFDPEIFDAAKDYVFQAMERDAFPGFLRAKGLGNLTPVSIAWRLTMGFVSLFGGLWTAFTLVFLNYSRLSRCWIILPLLVATYFIMSYEFMLDPILGILGYSEYTFMDFNRIRDPYIRSLTMSRSLFMAFYTLLITLAGCALFIFVPGPSRKVPEVP